MSTPASRRLFDVCHCGHPWCEHVESIEPTVPGCVGTLIGRIDDRNIEIKCQCNSFVFWYNSEE